MSASPGFQSPFFPGLTADLIDNSQHYRMLLCPGTVRRYTLNHSPSQPHREAGPIPILQVDTASAPCPRAPRSKDGARIQPWPSISCVLRCLSSFLQASASHLHNEGASSVPMAGEETRSQAKCSVYAGPVNASSRLAVVNCGCRR